MKLKHYLLLLALMVAIVANAQEVQVCDATTKLPIRNVQVKIDDKPFGKTDFRGIILLPDTFKTATFTHKSYHQETLFCKELKSDTLFLFNEKHYLDEVVIMGKHRIDGRALLKTMPERDILEKAPPHELGGFDLGLMLDKRLKRDKKHVEKLRKIFKQMDGTDTDDPIMRIYNQMKIDKQRKEIEQKIEESQKR
ncbi:hypothetical protein [Prevotella disiens]|uniref:hypothetical protein n=1 Tax=Prevotella disiens TaxID=28130 RepID=UPI002889B8E6|nr:hypothetical protein [Prevotella disiens]